MPRKKKPVYEYVSTLGKYRKRVKSPNGKYVALYADTADELTEKIICYNEYATEIAQDMEQPLFNDYANTWLSLNSSGISSATKKDYQRIITWHIAPYMEGKLLCDVLPKDIAYVMSFAVKLSESVHNKTYMLLKRISTSAYKSGFVMENPCTEMHNGGNQPEEKTALTKEQISVLLDSVAGTSTYVFCMIGLFSGLRKEEILGLNWDCVHLDGTPRIDVKRALRHPGNKPVLSTELKSAAAHRTVPIPSVLVACLRKEKESSSSQFVIKNSTNGALSKSQFNRLWNYVIRRTAKERTYYRYVDGVKTPHFIDARLGEKSKRGGYLYTIDFKVTPHILRHTYISNLLLAGVDIKTVQYLAGHEKSKTTLDIYSHLIYNRPEENLCKVNAAFSNKSTAPSLSQPTSPLQV